MIYKNATFGKTKNVTICEFGTGDIMMIGSKKGKNGEVILCFKTSEPKPINIKEKSEFSTYNEMKPEIALIFNKIESLDSVINSLIDCRNEMGS